MAVEPEDYGDGHMTTNKHKANVVRVERQRNGNWRVTVDVEVEIFLPDGRRVAALQEVKIRGRGTPKPKPDPKWLYEGRQGRARKRGKDGRG